jgi:hypothetical protein
MVMKSIKLLQITVGLLVLIGHKASALQGHVNLNQNGTNFVYVVFNDESPGSQLTMDSFELEVNAPFVSVASPPGWSYETDNSSYVDWFCNNTTPPYVHDIAPGQSLAGFGVQSVVGTFETNTYALSAWDNGATNSGPTILGSIAVPSVNSFSSTITNVSYSSSNTFNFSVTGIPTYSYAVQATINFTGWTLLATNASPFTIVDTNAPIFWTRFYRSLFVPDSNSSAILGD